MVVTTTSLLQEKFEERWQALLAPKLAEEQTHTRTDAAAVRKHRLDGAQVDPPPPSPPLRLGCLRKSMQKHTGPAYCALTGVISLQFATSLHCGVKDRHALHAQQAGHLQHAFVCRNYICNFANLQTLLQAAGNVQARLAGELEQHRVRLLSVFDNLHSRIMDAKTLAAAACKPVLQQDKVSSHVGLCSTCSCTCVCIPSTSLFSLSRKYTPRTRYNITAYWAVIKRAIAWQILACCARLFLLLHLSLLVTLLYPC